MVKDCVRFSACYGSAVGSKPSVKDDNVLVSITTALFFGVKMAVATDAYSKGFRFLDAWKALRAHRKFMVGSDAIVDEDDRSTLETGEMSDDAVVTILKHLHISLARHL